MLTSILHWCAQRGELYGEYIHSWWAGVGFNDYVALMVGALCFGWLLLKNNTR
jgi:hypothetical protein